MAHTQKNTLISLQETIKETYTKKKRFIFSRYELVKTDSIKKDLVITTMEDYNRIIVNWHILNIEYYTKWPKQ